MGVVLTGQSLSNCNAKELEYLREQQAFDVFFSGSETILRYELVGY